VIESHVASAGVDDVELLNRVTEEEPA